MFQENAGKGSGWSAFEPLESHRLHCPGDNIEAPGILSRPVPSATNGTPLALVVPAPAARVAAGASHQGNAPTFGGPSQNPQRGIVDDFQWAGQPNRPDGIQMVLALGWPIVSADAQAGGVQLDIQAQAAKHHYTCIDLAGVDVPASILALLPKAEARRKLVLPLGLHGTPLTVALSEPPDARRLDELRLLFDRPISIALDPLLSRRLLKKPT